MNHEVEEGNIIGTEEGEVPLYVPRRRREDGTRTLMEELSIATARQKVGSTIKVFWRRGEDRLWIKGFGEVEREESR